MIPYSNPFEKEPIQLRYIDRPKDIKDGRTLRREKRKKRTTNKFGLKNNKKIHIALGYMDFLFYICTVIKIKEIMTFAKKLEIFNNDLCETIGIIVNKIGVDTKNGSNRIRIRNDDFMFNIDGSPNNDYIVEVGEFFLFSAQGLTYNFNCISIEELCDLVDYIKTLK